MKLRPSYLMVAGFAVLLTVLFIRTTGIHIDERNYLIFADQYRAGDSESTGKPPLFYWINYKLYNEIAPWLGPLRPVTLYLFYMAAFSASLVWALLSEFGARRNYLALTFFVLLVSPLALLNETQVMMETASLSVVSLLFGALLRGGSSAAKHLRLFLLSGLLLALKVTAAPVVVLLAAVSWRNAKRMAVVLSAGAILGFLANAAALGWIVKAHSADNYGGPGEILNSAGVRERLTYIGSDIYLWLFFTGLAALAGVSAYVYRRRRRDFVAAAAPGRTPDSTLVTFAFGSLALTVFMQMISIHGFARYNYPVLWLGLLASVLLLARYRVVALPLLGAVFVFQCFPLWTQGVARFNLWPARTVTEFIQSGGTILMSAPVHRLVVQQLLEDPSPCYAVKEINAQERPFYETFFAFAFPAGRVAEDSDSCSRTIKVWRDPVTAPGACPDRCGESHRWRSCAYQRLVFYTVHEGLALNQICW